MFELKTFAGLNHALARLCLRDGRTRKEIAEAADLNASMLSGYCSGRRIPSLEHLDRLLSVLDVDLETFTYEMRDEDRKSKSPLVLWPKVLHNDKGELAALHLTTLLYDVRDLLAAQARRLPPLPGEPEVRPAAADGEGAAESRPRPIRRPKAPKRKESGE